MLVDYHIHVLAHGEYEYSEEWLEQYFNEARRKNINEIGLADHDQYVNQIDFQVIERVKKRFTDIQVKVGLEVDYFPGNMEHFNKLKALPLDYMIGSVHVIDGWPFDHPDFCSEFEVRSIDEVYCQYFNLIDQAAKEGYFNIMGHLDLVKIWGHRPCQYSTVDLVIPVLKSIKEAGLTIEINSAGLRKPVAELYPATDIIEQMYARGIPVTMGSDAHHPEQVAEELDKVALLLHHTGYRKIMTFKQRCPIAVPL